MDGTTCGVVDLTLLVKELLEGMTEWTLIYDKEYKRHIENIDRSSV
jgi:hypothetical protein